MPNKNSSDTLKESRPCRMRMHESSPLSETKGVLPSQDIVDLLFL